MARQGPGALGSLAFGVAVGVASRAAAYALMSTGVARLGSGAAIAGSRAGEGLLLPGSTAGGDPATTKPLPSPVAMSSAAASGEEPKVLYHLPNQPIMRSETSHENGRQWLAKIQADLAKQA
jgi:hypothetical protein